MSLDNLASVYLARMKSYWWSLLLVVLFVACAFALARGRVGGLAAVPGGSVPVLGVLGFQGVMVLLAPLFVCQLFMPDVSSGCLCQLLTGRACREAFFITVLAFSLAISVGFVMLGILASVAAIAVTAGVASIGTFEGVLPWSAQVVLCAVTCSMLSMLAGVASNRTVVACLVALVLWSGALSSCVISSGWLGEQQLCWVPAQYMFQLSQGVVAQPAASVGLAAVCAGACAGGMLAMRFKSLG